jgi:DNA-binding response OmpR family regulator
MEGGTMTDNIEILLVEDNPKDVELTLHALNKHNLANHVSVARDGQEALDFFFGPDALKRNGHPKLVLLDLKLPRVTGLEVLRTLKGNARTKMIPVVVLTSSTEERDMVESYDLGVNSYLRKPVDFGEFLDCAKTLGLYWLLMNRLPADPRSGGPG